jgi:predicted RNase H-like HicB family nuclease
MNHCIIEARVAREVVMKRTIEVVIFQEDDRWVAQALNVEVSSFGDTPEEARAAIQEALELYFEDDPDQEIPNVQGGRIEELHV